MWPGSVTPATKSFLGGPSDSTPPDHTGQKKTKKQECNVKWDIKTFHFWQQFVYHTGYFTPGTKISCRSLIQV